MIFLNGKENIALESNFFKIMIMYKKNQIFNVYVLDLAEKNQCYGKLEDGMSVFIQGIVAVGDHVNVEIIKIKKNYLVGKLINITKKSKKRIQPICKYFGICGGCKWQHINYNEQLRLKSKQVSDALIHIGLLDNIPVEECIPSKKIFEYRNKVDFSFTDLRYLTENEIKSKKDKYNKPLNFALGFHPKGCYSKALDIDSCNLATKTTNKILSIVRKFCLKNIRDLPIYSTKTHKGELRNLVIRHGEKSNQVMINLVTTTHKPILMKKLYILIKEELGDNVTTFVNSITSAKNTVAMSEKEYIISGEGIIYDYINSNKYQISANSFFQTNTSQAEILNQLIIDEAKLKKTDIVYDLFCGTASISINIAKHCKTVLGIEIVQSAIDDAYKNIENNNIKNCNFIKLDIKNLEIIYEKLKKYGNPNKIILDPPRAGLNKKTIEIIKKLAPQKLIYVTCNPASFARDANIICCQNSYSLKKCIPVDLFPQTNHVECIAIFESN